MTTWEGTHAYFISNACAQALLKNAFPIRLAVDMYMSEQCIQQNMMTLAMVPSIIGVVDHISDTTRNL